MNVQYIKNNGKLEYAIIPIALYHELLEQKELFDDLSAYKQAKLENEESIPDYVVNRLFQGENPLKVWREYRQLTQSQLAELSGVSQPSIAQVETGQRSGTITNLKKLALSLNVDLDDICNADLAD